MKINSIQEIIEDIRCGKMVVLMDDEDRENEGDLVMASSCVTPETINFMATHARGLICLTLTESRAKQLGLSVMVDSNTSIYHTNFAVSIDAAVDVTTGISVYDRAKTIEVAVAPHALSSDVVQPGHVFPIIAQPGGVLVRAGHTEAGCDLAKMAGFEASSVITEIMNEDGSMARRNDLEKFAEKHQLKLGTIEDLIHYRVANERCIECIKERDIDTLYGPFKMRSYQDTARNRLNHVLYKGDISNNEPCLVRVHQSNPLRDYFSFIPSGKEAFPLWTLQSAMEKVANEGRGVIIFVGNEAATTLDIENQLTHLYAEDGITTKASYVTTTEVGVGAQILVDLNVTRILLMGAPIKYTGLSGFGLTVEDFVTPPQRVK